MNRTAEAEMWWVVIGAVVALVVVIVLLVIFTERTSSARQGLSSCESKGGICSTQQGECPRGTLKASVFECPADRDCCIGNPQRCSSTESCTSGVCGTDGYCYG